MKDYVIATFPMKPLNKMKVGSLTAPLYTSFIAEKFKIKKVLSINILNSFKDTDYSKEYVDILKSVNLEYDDIFIDGYHTNELLNSIKQLDALGLLVEKEEEILSCSCNKIDMLFSSINEYENGLLKHENDKYMCTSCGEECMLKKEKRLFLKIDNKYLKKVKAIPNIYDDNLNCLKNNFKNQEYLISKSRDNGIIYKGYNLDIDFVWSTYISLFKEKNIVIVTSNRHLMKVFFTNYIANIFNKKMIYVLHPYIEKKEPIDWNQSLFKYDKYYQHLYLLYSCRWNSRDCFYDIGMFNSLAKLRADGRKKLYDYLISNSKYSNFYNYLNEFISNKLNFQNNIKEINRNKILVADYDNTLHVYYDSLVKDGIEFKFNSQYYRDENVEKKINKFRKNNLFCINTGRSYKSFKDVCNFKYDYLICNNGCEVYNENDELLYLNSIDKRDIDIINKYDFKDVLIKKYYPNKNKKKYTMVSVSITTNEKEFDEIIKYFKTNLSKTKVYYEYPKIRLVNDQTNKLLATEKLIKIIGLDRDNVYAIGDDNNDILLLKEYKSGTFKWAKDKVKKEKIKEYESVMEFMNIIECDRYEK